MSKEEIDDIFDDDIVDDEIVDDVDEPATQETVGEPEEKVVVTKEVVLPPPPVNVTPPPLGARETIAPQPKPNAPADGSAQDVLNVIAQAIAYKGSCVVILRDESDLGLIPDDGSVACRIKPNLKVRALWRKL